MIFSLYSLGQTFCFPFEDLGTGIKGYEGQEQDLYFLSLWF